MNQIKYKILCGFYDKTMKENFGFYICFCNSRIKSQCLFGYILCIHRTYLEAHNF